MKLYDMGQPLNTPAVPDKYYPSLTVDLVENPQLSKEVGEECMLVIKAKVCSKSISENHASQTFEIRKIAVEEPEDEDENEADKALLRLKGKR